MIVVSVVVVIAFLVTVVSVVVFVDVAFVVILFFADFVVSVSSIAVFLCKPRRSC